MLWFFLSLLTALAVATTDAWIKKWFSSLSAYDMLAYPLLYSLPFLIVTIFFVPIPELDTIFYIVFLISLPINAGAFLMYMEAIKVSPLSLTVPYLAFTPTFIILTGYLFLNEMPSFWGIAGILATCIGGYVLNLDGKDNSFLAPFKAIRHERGSWLMLICAFIFGLSAVIGKLAMQHSSQIFFSISFFLVLNISMVALLLAIGKVKRQTLAANRLKGFFVGILLFVHIICHSYAIMLTKAAYMISIKRLSVLISVVYGGIIFHEENIIQRFLSALLMFCGALIILLKG